MRIALIQTGVNADKHTKQENIDQALKLISASEAELIILPEMWPIGYTSFNRYVKEAEPLDGKLVQTLQNVAKQKGCYLVPGSFAEIKDGKIYNTTLFIDKTGEILGVYRKIHVFSFESQEKEIVASGKTPVVFNTPFGKVGLAVCYDLRFPELFRYMAQKGAKIFFVPASWPTSRKLAWQLFVTARAHENLCYCVACNTHADSLVVAPMGNIVAQGAASVGITYANIDLAEVEKARAGFPALNDAKWNFD